MINWKIILISLMALLIGNQFRGQTSHPYSKDTLVFQKIRNTDKHFKMPLNDYPVFIKSKNLKKKEVILTGYTDSTLVFNTSLPDKDSDWQAKYDQLDKIYSDTTLTATEIDSLCKLVVYSVRDTISINQIDKIIILNSNRKEMKRIMQITEWSALTTLFVGIPAIMLFKSLAYYMTWNVVAITITVVSIITEKKKLKFDKWEIVH